MRDVAFSADPSIQMVVNLARSDVTARALFRPLVLRRPVRLGVK